MKRHVFMTLAVVDILTGTALAEDPVSFADANLELAVEEALYLDDPMPSDMLGLTELTCINGGIADLTGLEYATNLQSLNLRMNRISNLSMLSGLTALRTLNLSKNEINDLSDLAGLVDLQELDIHLNRLSDISALSGLVSLETLTLRWNQINDISPLSNLTCLKYLNLQDNLVSHIPDLSKLVRLEFVELYGNPISDLSGLLGLTNLGVLDLRGNLRLSQEVYCLQMHILAKNNPYVRLQYEPNPTPLQGLSASNGTFWDRVRITWDEVCNGPNYTTYYEVSRSTSPEGPLKSIGPWQTALYFEDTTAEPDNVYSYRVRKATSPWGLDVDPYSVPVVGWLSPRIRVLKTMVVDDDAPGDPGPCDPNVSDLNENGTPEHPFDSIQEAIDVARKGAKVIVRPGIYLETINLLGKAIEVNGLNSDDPNMSALPVIDGRGKGTVVRCTQQEDPNCMLSGLVITGGKGNLAGGIHCSESSPRIVNCLIVGNRATESDSGGGIYCQESKATFVNCTIADNYGGVTGAGLWFKDSRSVIVNSIVWGNGPAEVLVQGAIRPVIGYSDMAGGQSGEGNQDSDPLFVRPGYWADPADLTKPMPAFDPSTIWVSGDYHLMSMAGRWDPMAKVWVNDTVISPCIDAGEPALSVGQEPSPNGGRINMGAYGGTTQASLSNK